MDAPGGYRKREFRQLLVSIHAGQGSDSEEVEELARRLGAELLQLEVESITPVAGPSTPEGAKAGTAVSWSALALTLVASGGVLTTVIGTVRDWLLRQSKASIAIEVTMDGDSIKLESTSTEERQRLIDAFVSRHGGESA